MNRSGLEALMVVLDHLRWLRSGEFVDSTTQRQEELDRLLATMLQEQEDRRVAESLQKQEKEIHGDLEGSWRKEKEEKEK